MSLNRLPLAEVFPNPDQPRKHFRQDKLEELAASIEKHGLLEPIVVVRRGNGYMIVGGERRWRACQMTERYKSKGIPARCIVASAEKVQELAIIENLQREDLTLIEEAKAYQSLLDRGLTPEQVAERLGLKQAWRVTERTSLLKLAPEYQDALTKGVLTPSQAFEMSRLNPEHQRKLFVLIGQGKADTYNKLRALTTAMIQQEQQPGFFAPPDPKQQEVRAKYDRMLEGVLRLVERSFDAEDMSVLKTALQGNVALNVERIDLIIKHLNKIKRALVEAQSHQEVLEGVGFGATAH
jgi:ParB family chromosome partitioning protein